MGIDSLGCGSGFLMFRIRSEWEGHGWVGLAWYFGMIYEMIQRAGAAAERALGLQGSMSIDLTWRIYGRRVL